MRYIKATVTPTAQTKRRGWPWARETWTKYKIELFTGDDDYDLYPTSGTTWQKNDTDAYEDAKTWLDELTAEADAEKDRRLRKMTIRAQP